MTNSDLAAFLILLLGCVFGLLGGVYVGWTHRSKLSERDAKINAEATAEAMLNQMENYDPSNLRRIYKRSSENNYLKCMRKL